MRTRTDRQAQVLCDFDFGVAFGPLASPKSTPWGAEIDWGLVRRVERRSKCSDDHANDRCR
jgi:hypothetical protein